MSMGFLKYVCCFMQIHRFIIRPSCLLHRQQCLRCVVYVSRLRNRIIKEYAMLLMNGKHRLHLVWGIA